MKPWILHSAFLFGMLATVGALAGDDPSALAQRARLFWEARVSGDWATEYGFTPAEDRGKATVEQFVAHRRDVGPFRYFSARVGEAATADAIGWVDVQYDVKVAKYLDLPARHVQIWDLWRKRDGEWYPMPKAQRKEFPRVPPQHRSAQEEAVLGQRVDALWKARVAGQWARTYAYLDPEFRASTPEKVFKRQKPRYLYLSHRLEWVEAVGDEGRAKVAVRRKPNDPSLTKADPQEVTMLEDWVKIKGQWYRSVPKAEGTGE